MNNNDVYYHKIRTMDLSDLHIFRTVVEAGGITRARDRERADLPRELGERGAEAGGPVLTAERALSSDDRTCTVCPT